MEAEIQQLWVIYGLQHTPSLPHAWRAKSIVSDSLLISNRPRIYNCCDYMDPPLQEAYLYIIPARFHHPRCIAVVVVHM